MASRGILVSTVMLRLLVICASAASVTLLLTNTFTVDGTKKTFKDVIGFRYVVAIGIIGFVYSLIQLPFSVYYAVKEKKIIKTELFPWFDLFLPWFDFYGDKIVAFLLATGVGVGFGLSFELKRFIKEVIHIFTLLGFVGLDEFKRKADKYLDRATVATAFLGLGFICLALLSVITSLYKANSSKGIFG